MDNSNAAQIEATAQADAFLNNAAMPTYTELAELLKQATYFMTMDKGSAYISVEYMKKQDALRNKIRAKIIC